jgi:omega-6 fatty acid desaturase (delta-12 desaturase)
VVEEQALTPGRFLVPNYTNKQLMDAIPAHCFERSALRSSVTIVQDVIALAVLAYGAAHIEEIISWAAPKAAEFSPVLGTPAAATAARWSLWAFYWAFSSFWGMGLWVVGHECGHQAFSTSKTINNSVGWVIHSLLLVPYHAWRISHGRHHASTGSLTRDEVFVPRTRTERNLPAAKDDDEVVGFE